MGTPCHILFCIYLIFVVHSVISPDGICHCAGIPSYLNKESINLNIAGCLPCSQNHLLKSYYDKHDSLLESDFQGFLAQELSSLDSCKGLIHDLNFVLRLSVLQRHLIGEGSHRRLRSSMKFDYPSDAKSMHFVDSCEAVIIEGLPLGVFADPFELQHLVHRGVFVDAAVFGDANLELPSVLSNRSAVEVHMGISYNLISRHNKGFEISLDLPLHARYPPLDGVGGYSTVEMGSPNLMMRCRLGKEQDAHCLWMSIARDKESISHEVPVWQIPCGRRAHAGFISAVTFLSALASALVIVLAAISYSSQTHDTVAKDS